jgi:hypothetical protein
MITPRLPPGTDWGSPRSIVAKSGFIAVPLVVRGLSVSVVIWGSEVVVETGGSVVVGDSIVVLGDSTEVWGPSMAGDVVSGTMVATGGSEVGEGAGVCVRLTTA